MNELTIREATLSLAVVTLDRKSLTIAVYDQMPTDTLGPEHFDAAKNGGFVPLWTVNRCPVACVKRCREDREERRSLPRGTLKPWYWADLTPHVHVIANYGNVAHVMTVPMVKEHAFADFYDYVSEVPDEWRTLHEQWRALPQAYISVGR